MWTTLWPLAACVALLVATGWWIGRQFAADVAATGSRRLTVAISDNGPWQRDVRRRLPGAMRQLAPHCAVRIVSALPGAQPERASLHLEHFADDTGAITYICHPPALHPESAAVGQLSRQTPPKKDDWLMLAALILANGGVRYPLAQPDGVHIGGFAVQYLSSWQVFRGALDDFASPQQAIEAYGQLRCCLDVWPAIRAAEKPVALANLARLCLVMPKTPVTRVPRLLEGLDAARAALQLTYDTLEKDRIAGLRALLDELRRDLATAAVETHPASVPDRPDVPPECRQHGLTPEACPHRGNPEGHGAERIRP